jgi:bromodomain-containing factor 1
MDLSTVAKKLQTGAYQRAKDFEGDVRLIFSNCYKFNPSGNPVREMGKQLEAVFEEKWASKQQWDADNAPTIQSSPEGSDEEESDDEETEQAAQQATAPSATATAAAAMSQRLIEEQTKLIALMSAKNPDQDVVQMQQDLVAFLQSRIAESAKSPTVGKKAPKKAKAPKSATKKPVAKKTSNKKAPRQRYLGTLEKETISAGLASLPDEVAESVLQMIKNDKPDVDVSHPTRHITLHMLTTT